MGITSSYSSMVRAFGLYPNGSGFKSLWEYLGRVAQRLAQRSDTAKVLSSNLSSTILNVKWGKVIIGLIPIPA